MRHKRKTFHVPKGFKWALGGLAIALGIFLGAMWYWNANKNRIIRNKIEEAIQEGSLGLYKVDYDTLLLDEAAGWMKVYNMKLRYDSNKYQAAGNTDIPPVLLNITIPEISISGVETPKALTKKQIRGKRMEIRQPVVEMYYTYRGKDSARNVPTREVYEQILGKLKSIEIDTILITGAMLKTADLRNGRTIVAVEDIALVLDGVKIDSAAQADTSRMFFSRQVSVSAGKIDWLAPNGMYRYTISNALMHSGAGELQVAKFNITPQLGEDAFVKRMNVQDDRYQFSFSNIRMARLDVRQLIGEYLQADTLYLPEASFKIYRDLARPRDDKSRVGRYPHQVIDHLPMTFEIRNIVLSNGFVEYKERNHITRESGKVQFYRVNARIRNFTNDRQKTAGNNRMTADISTAFLNRAILKTNWTFYLRHPKGRFDVTGSMGAMDALAFNALAEPMGPARIEKGNLKGLVFNLNGSNYGMNGKVKVMYNDLKVSLLEKDKGATETDRKFLASFIANIVIKNNNPKNKDEEPREAVIENTRDTNRSIFNLCWKTLFKGIKETLGVKR